MKGSIEIFSHDGGSMEHWLLVNPDGMLTYHVENSGARCIRQGCEPEELTLTPEAIRRWPRHEKAIRNALAVQSQARQLDAS